MAKAISMGDVSTCRFLLVVRYSQIWYVQAIGNCRRVNNLFAFHTWLPRSFEMAKLPVAEHDTDLGIRRKLQKVNGWVSGGTEGETNCQLEDEGNGN